ncbi:unnamed protein product [Calypogeia fissa]
MYMQNVKKSHPGLWFSKVGKVLGDMWKEMSANIGFSFSREEKAPFEATAKSDEEWYKQDIFKSTRGAMMRLFGSNFGVPTASGDEGVAEKMGPDDAFCGSNFGVPAASGDEGIVEKMGPQQEEVGRSPRLRRI